MTEQKRERTRGELIEFEDDPVEPAPPMPEPAPPPPEPVPFPSESKLTDWIPDGRSYVDVDVGRKSDWSAGTPAKYVSVMVVAKFETAVKLGSKVSHFAKYQIPPGYMMVGNSVNRNLTVECRWNLPDSPYVPVELWVESQDGRRRMAGSFASRGGLDTNELSVTAGEGETLQFVVDTDQPLNLQSSSIVLRLMLLTPI